MNTTQNTQITEADVVAYLAAMTAKYRKLFPDVRELSATTSFGEDPQVGFFGYKDDSFNGITAYGATFDEAAAELRERLGTPEEKAAKLREQAAKMLAEADQLQNGRAA